MSGMISIVLPVHNQADHIGGVVSEFETALTAVARPYEIILVANDCSDDSWKTCQTLAANHPGWRAIRTARRGWGLAVKLGLREARGDVLCYTNSARTTGQDLALLLGYALAHPNVVVKANRKSRERFRRRLGSLLYNLECRALFDLAVWDINGTPKIFPRTFSTLLQLTQDDDLIDAEFLARCRREGHPVLEIPIYLGQRRGGKSTTGWLTAARLYWGAWRMRRAWGPNEPKPAHP